ncbi:MAG: hypothetical protein M3O09_00065 [Acidobacteriota bacterium]|nr:hypothetical protein [Acidobacteriota bacterium]
MSLAVGYIDTEVEPEARTERRYRVKDFWKSHTSFEAFRVRFAAKYEKLNQLIVAEGLVERQQLVGEYCVDDGTNGDDLVSAEG